MNKKQHLNLSDDEICSLTSLIKNGQLPAKVFRRATALLELARGKGLTEVATTLGVAYQTVGVWRDNYKAAGADSLPDKARSGRPPQISGTERAKITALACSRAPGRLRSLEFAPLGGTRGRTRIGRRSFAQRSWQDTEKNELKPHLKQTWCIGTINAAFLAQMEQILWLYSLGYEALFPVVCLR